MLSSTNESANVSSCDINDSANSGQGESFLRCLSLNARSLLKKKYLLEAIVRLEIEVDVIFVCETWAKSDTVDAELAISGFQLYKSARVGRRAGGLQSMFVPICILQKFATWTFRPTVTLLDVL
jgi:hypothetical protein